MKFPPQFSDVAIAVQRLLDDGDTTVSAILVDGEDQLLYGVEDQAQMKKVAGETRIPAGKYPLRLWTPNEKDRQEHNKDTVAFAPHSRYAKLHVSRGMTGVLEIADIPGFSAVLIHAGNTDDHTEGCLLPNLIFDWEGMRGGQSRPAVAMITQTVGDRLLAGEKLYIIIADGPLPRLGG